MELTTKEKNINEAMLAAINDQIKNNQPTASISILEYNGEFVILWVEYELGKGNSFVFEHKYKEGKN